MNTKRYRYTLDFFETLFLVWFVSMLAGTILVTTLAIKDFLAFVFHSRSVDLNRLFLFLVALYPMWSVIHIVWKELRNPIIWLSDTGITVLVITPIPVKTHISWKNIIGIKDHKNLEGTLFKYGTAIEIKPVGNKQKRIFRIVGKNEIFISSKIAGAGELVEIITEKVETELST